MSHLYYKPKRTRLQRSELAVPRSSPQMFEKAFNSDADYVSTLLPWIDWAYGVTKVNLD